MSTTISYKGTTLATVSNNTKTLETEGKYLEADVILTDTTPVLPPAYTGATTVTPTESTQTLPTSGKTVGTDITVNPIPSNYFDTSDADNLGPGDVLAGEIYYDSDGRQVGEMPNHMNDNDHPVIDDKDDLISFGYGYWDSHDVQIDSTEKAKIIPGNIKSGVSILGVTGTHQGGTDTSDATIQSGAQMLSGVTAYGANGKVTGTLIDVANPQLAVAGYSASGNVFLLTGASNPQNPYPFASTDGRATVAVPKALMGNAVQAQVLEPYTFSAADGIGMQGLMPDNGAVAENIATKSAQYVVPIGYHNGNGVVQIDPTEQAKIIPGNIKFGATILGVAGTYQGDQVTVSYGDLLTAVNLGAITVTSTSATNLNKSATIPGVYGYDIIIVVIRRTSKEYGHHWQTISDIHLSELTVENETSGQTNVNAKQQKRYTTSGDTLTYDGTTAYGIYVNSISRTGDTLTLTIYGRYNAGFTLAIDGDYILYAYGLKYR